MDRSPLGKLPAAVRCRIFDLALYQDKVYVHARLTSLVKIGLHYSPKNSKKKNTASNILALTRACRQIREESTQLFYASNTFIFTYCGKDHMKAINVFKEHIGPKVAKLPRVTVKATRHNIILQDVKDIQEHPEMIQHFELTVAFPNAEPEKETQRRTFILKPAELLANVKSAIVEVKHVLKGTTGKKEVEETKKMLLDLDEGRKLLEGPSKKKVSKPKTATELLKSRKMAQSHAK